MKDKKWRRENKPSPFCRRVPSRENCVEFCTWQTIFHNKGLNGETGDSNVLEITVNHQDLQNKNHNHSHPLLLSLRVYGLEMFEMKQFHIEVAFFQSSVNGKSSMFIAPATHFGTNTKHKKER